MSFQGYLNNIEAKTGKTADDFKKLAEVRALPKMASLLTKLKPATL